MDKQVQLAMAKWPNVPDCRGWLALDARGAWRMRDQRCQDLGLPGSKIGNVALREFIARNYLRDDIGQYYFQNGPQRVFVTLEATPHIAHADPQRGWVLHTGEVLEGCDTVWCTPDGNLILGWGDYLAQIDDRDMAVAMEAVRSKGQPASDDQILAWLGQLDASLHWQVADRLIPIRATTLAQLQRDMPFVGDPAR